MESDTILFALVALGSLFWLVGWFVGNGYAGPLHKTVHLAVRLQVVGVILLIVAIPVSFSIAHIFK